MPEQTNTRRQSASSAAVLFVSTQTPFEAVTLSLFALAITQSNKASPETRLATRKGSSAAEKAIIEKLGTRRKPTLIVPADLLDSRTSLILSSVITLSMVPKKLVILNR